MRQKSAHKIMDATYEAADLRISIDSMSTIITEADIILDLKEDAKSYDGKAFSVPKYHRVSLKTESERLV
jgi:hypothetical protein